MPLNNPEEDWPDLTDVNRSGLSQARVDGSPAH
jgi:hypothetical protein